MFVKTVTIEQACRILECSHEVVRRYMNNYQIERIGGGASKIDPILVSFDDVERVRIERQTQLKTWRSRLVICLDHPDIRDDALKASGLSIRLATSTMDAVSQVPIGDTAIIVVDGDTHERDAVLISTFVKEGACFIDASQHDTIPLIRLCWRMVANRSQGLI